MKWCENLVYNLLGPFWPEYLVAKELRKKGWKVYRQFHCYDPKQAEYAEIDILGVAHDGFILAEVKSYQGKWESLDDQPKPMWRKKGYRRRVKSPVWQIKRARLALINSLLRAYPNMNAKVLDSCRTYVFLDRGSLINGDERSIRTAWSKMQVNVLPLSKRNILPIATKPAAESFLVWLERYRRHFKWRGHYKLFHKFGWLDSYIQRLEKKWETLQTRG